MGTEVGPVGNENVETEVEFRQPRGTNRMSKERPIITGVIAAETDERDPGQTHRFGSLGGAKPKRPEFELPNSRTPGPRRTPPGTGEQPEKESGTTTGSHLNCRPPMYSGPGRQPSGAGDAG